MKDAPTNIMGVGFLSLIVATADRLRRKDIEAVRGAAFSLHPELLPGTGSSSNNQNHATRFATSIRSVPYVACILERSPGPDTFSGGY